MKKLVLFAAIMLCSLIPLEVKADDSGWIDGDITYTAVGTSATTNVIPTQEIYVKDNTLYYTLHNVITAGLAAGGTAPEPYQYIQVKENRIYVKCVFMSYQTGIAGGDDENENPADPSITLYDITWSFPGFSAGHYLLDMDVDIHAAPGMTGNPYRVSFGIDITETPTPVNILTQESGLLHREWVVYNDETGRIFRMRLGEETSLPTIGENILPCYPMYLYEDLDADLSEAPVIAYISKINNDGGYNLCMAVADCEIPGEFWSSYFKDKTRNPRDMEGDIAPYLNKFSVAGGTVSADKNYYADYLTGGSRPYKVDGFEKRDIDGKETMVKLLSWNNEYTGEVQWMAEWLPGIGPIGENIASNPVYPIYVLPDSGTPTSLLYVRDLRTNKILWGDPSKDKDYMLGAGGVAAGPASLQVRASKGVISVECAGGFRVYGADGRVVTEGKGSLSADVPSGIYIVVGEGETRKIVVP
ncbi:MAG: hypothetical protein HDS74_06110 [Bacteroidales bacterium]|nr:hypothetical protein [Bacteroidales bacterium]